MLVALFALFSSVAFLFSWFAFATLVGVFAHVRRRRGFVSWFVLAILFSPLFAGLLVAILRERPPRRP
jgi:hypothetical protein